LTVTETPARPPEGADGPGRAARAAVLTLLGVDGVLSAVAAALFLPTYLGRVPFPISAVIDGLVNAALVWAGTHWTASLRLAALPVWTWLATIAAMTVGGPGDDFIFAGRGVMAYGVLFLIVVGAAPATALLWWLRYRNPATRVRVVADDGAVVG
jgi:hypothetical protein